VLVSIPSDDGALCVDVFEDPDRDFGFQQFRSDAEDQGAWTTVGGAERGYDDATIAAAAAVAQIGWLTSHARAKQVLEDWLATR